MALLPFALRPVPLLCKSGSQLTFARPQTVFQHLTEHLASQNTAQKDDRHGNKAVGGSREPERSGDTDGKAGKFKGQGKQRPHAAQQYGAQQGKAVFQRETPAQEQGRQQKNRIAKGPCDLGKTVFLPKPHGQAIEPGLKGSFHIFRFLPHIPSGKTPDKPEYRHVEHDCHGNALYGLRFSSGALYDGFPQADAETVLLLP